MTIKRFGRPTTYPMSDMVVGDIVLWPAPDGATIKKTTRNTSQYGIRHGKYFVCRTDKKLGVTVITRIR
jgi:hypothetical protein